MKHILAIAFAFSALATTPLRAQPEEPAQLDVYFNRVSAEMGARSIENCDPDVDTPSLSAERSEHLKLHSLRRADNSNVELVTLSGFANSAAMSVCYDSRLKDTPYEAAVYAGRPRVIALNPASPANVEQVLLKSYALTKSLFMQLEDGTLKPEDMDKPLGLLPTGAVAAEPPAKAPRKQPEYR